MERRASCTALRVGHWVRQSQKIVVSWSWNHVQGVRNVVFQATRETMRDAHVVTDQAAAMFHEWCEGTPGGTLGLKGRELIAMLEEEFTLERGVTWGRPWPGWVRRLRDTAPASGG